MPLGSVVGKLNMFYLHVPESLFPQDARHLDISSNRLMDHVL